MDAQTFLHNFATIADAPDGVHRLRDLVLDLAVSGRLVEQVRVEGEGRSVVEGGAVAIADAVASGWSRRREPPDPTPDEFPFPIPDSWIWARLPRLAHGLGQLTPESNFTYIDVSSVNGEEGVLRATLAVIAPEAAPSRARKAVDRGVVLYSTIRPYLRNVVHIDRDFDPPAIASTAFAVLRPVPGLDPRYLKACLRSSYFSSFVASRQKGVAYPAINDSELAFGLVPVPPPAEQERIVARIDYLMSLCDELEARQAHRHRATVLFRGSALHALAEAEVPDEVRSAFERVSASWQSLTGQADAIPGVRRAVLQLAITGRLTERAPNTPPGGDARRTQRPPDTFGVPDGWRWIEFGEVCDQVTVGHVGPMASRYTTSGIPFLRSQNVEWFRYDPSDIKYIDEVFHAELSKSALFGGEVLAVRSGNVGRTCVLPKDAGPANCADLVIMRVGSELDANYAAIVMNSPYGVAHISSKKVGIAQAHFNVGAAKRMPTPVPPIEEQRRLVVLVHCLLDQCDRLEEMLARRASCSERLTRGLAELTVAY